MAERIYTRTGDQGRTGLRGGMRVRKDAMRIQAVGDLDELNCALAEAASRNTDADLAALLTRLQHLLFDLGADLAAPDGAHDARRLGFSHVENMEREIDRLDADLPPLRQFILPGGTPTAAALHTARAVCRRAERRCVALAEEEPVSPHLLALLNRLSDLLFVMARKANARARVPDVTWQPTVE